jgi:hypothetical protein
MIYEIILSRHFISMRNEAWFVTLRETNTSQECENEVLEKISELEQLGHDTA